MAQRNIAIKDLRRFVFVSDPQTNPDGTKVAFVHTAIDYENNDYVKHIWLHDVRSGNSSQFTTEKTVSPAGAQMENVFFSSHREDSLRARLSYTR